MRSDFDVIIVGSGPAGVSAAYPLVRAGLDVLMVDGGREATIPAPQQPFLDARRNDDKQWHWMLGEDFRAIRQMDAVSPKLRVPANSYVFDDFARINRIEANDFVAVGSLAKGGLSNAWGCGVARYSAQELADFPCDGAEMEQSYRDVALRVGISGGVRDDLSEFFGLDEWSQPPVRMDAVHSALLGRYEARGRSSKTSGFRLGRARVAALTQDRGDRKSCDNSGNCLWGCHRKSLYNAGDEIPALAAHPNFHYRSGFLVEQIAVDERGASVAGRQGDTGETIIARRVLLAAGTLATTRLALQALGGTHELPLLSCPMAAFLLWLPRLLGTAPGNGFGLGQLSFSLRLGETIDAFGSTFSTAGIPLYEFVRHVPLSRRYGIDLLKYLLGSCLVGNIFLPGHLSATRVRLDGDGVLRIRGAHAPQVGELMPAAAAKLRAAYGRLGALLLPGSFTIGRPGGDIHYAGTLPMRRRPDVYETDFLGALGGMPGVHIVDGACLPTLPAKSHTLTIMANADRIARTLAARWPAGEKAVRD